MRNQEARKRNNRVQVRLDNKEHQAFLKAVKRSRLSQEVYLRHLISGVVPQNAPPPDYYAMMQQLYRIGNNLNQIAQKAHPSSEPTSAITERTMVPTPAAIRISTSNRWRNWC